MTKLSKIGFFLFVSICNYLWLRIVMFPYFYNEYGSMGIYYIGIIAVSVLIIFLLLPKKLLYHSYEDAFKKSIFKYCYSIILLIETILGVCFCAYLLSKIFIPSGNFYFMLALIVATIIAVSCYKPKDVMEVSTLFLILGYAVLFISLFFYPNIDVSLLLPFKKTSFWALPFFVLMFVGDNLTFVLNKKDVQFTKINFILAMFTSILLFAIEYFILITNAGDQYFKNLNWVGFISLSIQPISKYIGTFDFAYIFYIMICCIFKFAYNLSLMRESITIDHKIMTVITSLLIFVSGIIFYSCIPINDFYFKLIGGVLLLSFSILFWLLKECYHVRKIKE